MFFPPPLGNVYKVSGKLDHFLNFRLKWVKTLRQQFNKVFMKWTDILNKCYIWKFLIFWGGWSEKTCCVKIKCTIKIWESVGWALTSIYLSTILAFLFLLIL